MKTVTKITQFIENFKNVHAEVSKIGFAVNHAFALERSLCRPWPFSSGCISSPCRVLPDFGIY